MNNRTQSKQHPYVLTSEALRLQKEILEQWFMAQDYQMAQVELTFFTGDKDLGVARISVYCNGDTVTSTIRTHYNPDEIKWMTFGRKSEQN